jgi:hypothetical protein
MPTMRRPPVEMPMNFITGSVHINLRLTASWPVEHAARHPLC